MARFHLALESLLSLRRGEYRQRQSLLAESLAKLATLQQHRADIEGKLAAHQTRSRDEIGPGALDVGAVIAAQQYGTSLRRELEELDSRREALEVEIELRRRDVVAADQQVRVLDKLRERRRMKYLADESRAAANLLDEAALRPSASRESA